jgi:hypothetical protein
VAQDKGLPGGPRRFDACGTPSRGDDAVTSFTTIQPLVALTHITTMVSHAPRSYRADS